MMRIRKIGLIAMVLASTVSLAARAGSAAPDYVLPANTDATRDSLFAIYCERFRTIFGTASLQPF